MKPLKAKLYLLDGKIIHVGDWDFQIQEPTEDVHVEDRSKHNGFRIEKVKTGEKIITNPIPKGVKIIENGEYTITADEQIVQPTDHVALRKSEYPPIHDYLDAVVKDDEKAIAAYKAKCLAVKKKYPKAK